MDKGLNSEASKWFASLGYDNADLHTPMDSYINTWWSYIRQEDNPFYWLEEPDTQNPAKKNKIKVRSCTPASMICDDMAGLIYNETASISLDEVEDGTTVDWLEQWLDVTMWHDRAPLAIGRMCSTGTAAWALHVSGFTETGKSSALKVCPMRYDARSIIPLSWEADDCIDCAFLADVYIRGNKCTQIEVHQRGDDGNYQIYCGFFDDTGKQFVPAGYLDSNTSVNTKQPYPTFSLIRLAFDNPYWDYSPMGVALFHDAIDALKTVDLAFNNMGDDLIMGRKLLVLPESMLSKDEYGNAQVPMLTGKRFFVAVKSNTYDEKARVFEYNPSLRTEENRQALSTALQMLGKRIGFGIKAYALDDQGGITTAKQVAADNSEMMRAVRRHEHIIKPAIQSLITAACGIYRELGTTPLVDIAGQVNVVLGDSIMQDDDSLRERDRADVAAGLLEPWKYMVRWQGYTEEEAREAQGALDDAALSVPIEA
nr:MAG TPA: portal protein [Caudoviricetes sp.]